MNIKIIEDKKIIMSNPHSMHSYFGWPTVARLKNGKIAVAASGFRTAHVCPFGKAVVSFSEDDGKTFASPSIVTDSPLDDRDVGLCAFGKSGLILTSFNNTREFQRKWARMRHYNKMKSESVIKYIDAYLDNVSDDEEKRYLGSNFKVSFDNGITFGDFYKSPITSPHGPCELSDGSILWVGKAFSETDSSSSEFGICAAKLDVHSGDVKIIGKIDNIEINGITVISCEPHAVQTPEGKIVCHIRVQSADNIFTVFQSDSVDGGVTWSKPKRILDMLGGAPSHLTVLSNGALLAVYGYRERPYGIKAMISRDSGESWDVDNLLCIHDVIDDIGYPASVELSDGSILTVFYARPQEDESAVIYSIKWKYD